MTVHVYRNINAAGVWTTAHKVYRTISGGGVWSAPAGIRVYRLGSGPMGKDAKVSVGFYAAGPYGPRQLICGFEIPGGAALTAAASRARALTPCAAINTWDITLNGTFANPVQATLAEINAAKFGTIAFPAGLGDATWTYLTGGVVSDTDVLRFWESASPDASQANTSVMPAEA